MKVVKLGSGLGNQLFMYAFYRYIEQKYGEQTFFDDKYFRDQISEQRHSELSVIFPNYPVFKFPLNPAGETGWRGVLYSWFRYHFPICKMVYEDQYDDTIRYEGNVYFKGFWQTDKYVKTLDKKIFTPKEKIPKELMQVVSQILAAVCPVAIHIRRGDYFQGKYASIFGVCSSNYFVRAMQTLESLEKSEITYFVFSNDLEWVNANIPFKCKKVVVPNYNVNSFWYIYLMSLCHHNIISNSSFSWWGAYLNEFEGKKVLGPSRWMNNSDFDLMLPEWIKVKV